MCSTCRRRVKLVTTDRILQCVARCHDFFLAAKPLIQYQLSPLPAQRACWMHSSLRDHRKLDEPAAFCCCVNGVICLLRWKAVTRARLGGIGSAVLAFVKDVLSISADAITSPSIAEEETLRRICGVSCLRLLNKEQLPQTASARVSWR